MEVILVGQSGTQYKMHAHEQAVTLWNDIGGVYAFALWQNNGWHILYIGKAASLKDRLTSHERWAEACRKGARYIIAAGVPREDNRQRMEADLIARYQPEMNELLRGFGTA